MKRLFLLCSASALLLSVSHAQRPAFAPDRIIVKPAQGMSDDQVRSIANGHGASELHRIKQLNARVLKVNPKDLERVLAALKDDKRFAYAEKDYVAEAIGTANDPYFTSGQQWHLGKIQAPGAWDVSTGTTSVVVAVVDTGVNFSHPDLQGRLLGGYDFVNSDSNPSDDNGHGTASTGVIAACTNNAVGVAGVTWQTPVLPVKVLDGSGSGSYSNVAAGITYAADNGARIINLSLGGTYSSSALQDAVNYAWSKGVVIVAAAGNNGNSTPVYPAACTNVVAVSATNLSDARTSWSNYGSYVDIAAPGENIYTTYGSGYSSVNGTSFSSPITAAVAALIASTEPRLSNSQTVDVLLKNADDIGVQGFDTLYGAGRVNAARAVYAAKTAFVADTTAPGVAFSSPANGAIVAGTVTVATSATDNIGVTRSELLINGNLVAQSSSGSLSFNWNTQGYTNGAYTLQVRAYDSANNVGSSSITVNVNNAPADSTAPTVAITSPSDGTSLGRSINITSVASDNVGVTRHELYIDGKLVARTTGTTLKVSWNTSKVASGEHRLQSYAYDAAGNSAASTIVRVYK